MRVTKVILGSIIPGLLVPAEQRMKKNGQSWHGTEVAMEYSAICSIVAYTVYPIKVS